MSHGERFLKDLFPDLFLLSLVKDAFVASYIKRLEGGAYHWNPTFMHAIQDWALESVACCALIFLKSDGEDKIVLEVFLLKK